MKKPEIRIILFFNIFIVLFILYYRFPDALPESCTGMLKKVNVLIHLIHPDYESLREKGSKLLSEGTDNRRAEKLLSKYVKKTKDTAGRQDAMLRVLELKLDRGRRKQVKKEVRKLIKSGIDDPDIMPDFAGLLVRLKEFELAEKYMEKAWKNFPDREDVYENFAILYRMQGKDNESLSMFEKAVKKFGLDSISGGALVVIGDLYYEKSDYSHAMEVFELALNKRPNDIELKEKVKDIRISIRKVLENEPG